MRNTKKLRTRRDRNEQEIMEALRKAGAWVMQFDKPADLLVGYRQRWFWLEVKDPEQPPNKRKLTENEQAFELVCRIERLPFAVIETVEQALKAIGATQ